MQMLRAGVMAGTVAGPGDVAVSKTDKCPAVMELTP